MKTAGKACATVALSVSTSERFLRAPADVNDHNAVLGEFFVYQREKFPRYQMRRDIRRAVGVHADDVVRAVRMRQAQRASSV